MTVLISFQFFFRAYFSPSQRLPWLSAKSILSLVGDNERARWASNEHRSSRAPPAWCSRIMQTLLRTAGKEKSWPSETN